MILNCKQGCRRAVTMTEHVMQCNANIHSNMIFLLTKSVCTHKVMLQCLKVGWLLVHLLDSYNAIPAFLMMQWLCVFVALLVKSLDSTELQ